MEVFSQPKLTNMRKLLLLLLLVNLTVFAQEEQEMDKFDYNRWSVEIAGGLHKPERPFALGYYAATPSFGQVSLGTRYMFNNYFGLKLDLGYSIIKSADESLEFESHYFRSSLQGVVNLGGLFHFESWTNRIGLLMHAGAGYSYLAPKEPVELVDSNDNMLNVIGGLTPQIKLSESLALTGDVSFIGNIRQTLTWDGTEVPKIRGFDGFTTNFSIGLSLYLGDKEKHADWAPISQNADLEKKVIALEERLEKVETDMIDSDQDGVADYLDREPNSRSGAIVDTKGVEVTAYNMPEGMKKYLEDNYVSQSQFKEEGMSIKDIISKGYQNVYFRFNSDKPETYSYEAINYLIVYMRENPSSQAELVGYADELGNADYNLQLSERRAKKVYDILIASGVSADRLSYSGGGEKTTADKSSEPARQLVRYVTFKLK